MKWIGIEDRLPELNIEVIVMNCDGVIAKDSIMSRAHKCANGKMRYIPQWGSRLVEYWIPMPTGGEQ